MTNLIPYEIISYDDKDSPCNRIKKLIHERINLHKDYHLTLLKKKLPLAMEKSKDTYYSNLSTKLVRRKSSHQTC